MNEMKRLILNEIELNIFPLLADIGFSRSLSKKNNGDRGFAVAYPLGYMKRANSAGDLELIEFQFDKQGAEKFVVNFGSAPPGGVVLPWARIGQEDVFVSDLPEGYRLKPSKMSQWFSATWIPMGASRKARRMTDKVLHLYPEIEGWFRARKVGEHIERYCYPIPLGAAAKD